MVSQPMPRRPRSFWGKLFRRRRLLNRELSNGLRPPNSSGLLLQSTHCYGRRSVDSATRRRTEGSPRDLRGFGSCERQFRRRETTEPKPEPKPMSTAFHQEVPEPGPAGAARLRRGPLTETSQTRRTVRIRLDFCRKARIAIGVVRRTSSPAGAPRARPATCGALGRASANCRPSRGKASSGKLSSGQP